MPVVYYLEPVDQGQPCQHATHNTTGRGTAIVSHDGTLYCNRDLEQTTGYLGRNWDYQETRRPGRDALFQDKGVVRGPEGLTLPVDIVTYDAAPKAWEDIRPNDFTPARTYDFVTSYTTTDPLPVLGGFFTVRCRGTDLRGAGVAEALAQLNEDLIRNVFRMGGRDVAQTVTWRQV